MGATKKKSGGGDHLESSPQISVQAAQRKKILSPKRQKFENNFEKHMHTRYVEKPVAKLPEDLEKLEERPPFDTVIRAEGTLNCKIQQQVVTDTFLEGRKRV